MSRQITDDSGRPAAPSQDTPGIPHEHGSSPGGSYNTLHGSYNHSHIPSGSNNDGGGSYNGPHVVGGNLKTMAGSGSVLKDALLDISAVRGRDALLSPHLLEKELRKRGVGELELRRLALLSGVQGYVQLIEARSGQYDVERFVYHALRETGLRRDIILDLAGTLASLSGANLREAGNSANSANNANSAGAVPDRFRDGDGQRAERLPEGGENGAALFPIPVGFYQEELDSLRDSFYKADREGTDVSPDALARLRPLASAGIPEARFLLGAYLLRKTGETVPRDETEGSAESGGQSEALDLLRAAAADGESHAAAALGDYYYARRGPGDWAEAFRRYTGFGALALDDRRRTALVDILNQKITNQRLFRSCGILSALLALLFLVPAAPLYGGGWVWCGLFLLSSGGVLWDGLRRFKREPYGEYCAVPVFLLAAFTVCWLLRVLI